MDSLAAYCQPEGAWSEQLPPDKPQQTTKKVRNMGEEAWKQPGKQPGNSKLTQGKESGPCASQLIKLLLLPAICPVKYANIIGGSQTGVQKTPGNL